MKKSRALALKAVAVPAVVLISMGGGLLVSAPALAAGTNTSTNTNTTGSATAAATSAPATAAPTPAAAPAPTATATPSASAAPTPTATLPTDLTVTSPAGISDDYDSDDAIVVDSRTVVFAGKAPVGAKIAITDIDDNDLGTAVSDSAGNWTVSVTYADDLAYNQYVFIDGTSRRGGELTSYFANLNLPAASSVTPVITSPADGESLAVAPAPFNEGALVTFTGTATPGDYVSVTPVDGDADESFTFPVLVKKDGTWSQSILSPYGTKAFTAGAQAFDVDGQGITYPSDPSATVSVDLTTPAGFIAAPRITSPSDPDSLFSSSEGEVTYSGSSVPVESAAVAPLLETQSGSWTTTEGSATAATAADTLGRVKAAAAARGITVSAESLAADAAVPVEASAVASAAAAAGDATADAPAASGDGDAAAQAPAAEAPAAEAPAAGDELTYPGPGVVLTPAQVKLFLDEFDQIVAGSGIQVKGQPDPTEPGKLLVTVSGTGTAGQGIQLYAAKPSVAYPYFQGLYPDYFAQSFLLPNVPESTVPAYDGSVTVGADGKWSTTLALAKGAYFVTAFAVDKADPAALRYSAAGDVVAINLTGTPAVAVAAATPGTQLAFTGSDVEGSLWAALALLGGGVAAMLAASVRRRGRSIR